MGDKILDDDHCSSLSLSSTELSDEGDSVRSDSSRHRVKDLKRQTEKWAECTAEWRERWEKMKIDRDAILKKARHYKHKLEKTRDKVDSLEDTIKELKEENTTLREKLSTIECQDDEGMDQFERRGTVRFRRRSEPVRRQSPTSTLAAMKDEGLGSSAESTSPPATPGGLDLSAFSLSPTLKIIEDLVSKHGTAVTDSSQQEGPAASPLTSRSPPVTRGHQENELRDDFSFWKLKKSALSQSASMPAIVHATGAKKTVESRPRTATAPRRKDPGADNAASGKKSSSGPLPSSSQVPSRPVEPKVIPSRSTSARPESRLPTRPDSRVNSATPTSAPPTAAPNTNSKPSAAMATGPRSTNPSSTERSTSVRPGDGRQTSRKSDGRSKGPSFLDLASRKAMYTAAVMLSENCDKNLKAILAEPKPPRAQAGSPFQTRAGLPREQFLPVDPPSLSPTHSIPDLPYQMDAMETSVGVRLVVIVSLSVTQEQLARLFDLVPGMEMCDLKVNPSGESKGYAVVIFRSLQAAVYAKEKLNGFEYPPGTQMIVRYAEDPRPPPTIGPPSPTSEPVYPPHQYASSTPISPLRSPLRPLSPVRPIANRQRRYSFNSDFDSRVFFIGQPHAPSEHILRDIFNRFGKLLDVWLVRGKNYGYAKFGNRSAAEASIKALHGMEVYGSVLKVMMADPPPDGQQKRA